MQTVVFDRPTARRIITVVRHAERERLDLSPSRRRHKNRGGGGLPWSKIPFGYSLSGNVATIYPGSLDYCIPGGLFTVSTSTEVTLTGTPAWVYLKRSRSGGAASVSTTPLSTHPESTTDEIRIALHRFESADGGATYTWEYWAMLEPRLGAPMS